MTCDTLRERERLIDDSSDGRLLAGVLTFTLPPPVPLESRLGTACGFESLHYLLEKAWDVPGESLSYSFLKGAEVNTPHCACCLSPPYPCVSVLTCHRHCHVALLPHPHRSRPLPAPQDVHAFDTNPIYAVLHESIYCNGGSASAWAAETAVRERFPGEFDAAEAIAPESNPTQPVYFTGEMVFPFMFREIAALAPLQPVAEALAQKSDWPALYNVQQLNRNEVPVSATAYFEDVYVDFDLAKETAGAIQGTRMWVTNEYMHSGLREDGAKILTGLMKMARNEEMLR